MSIRPFRFVHATNLRLDQPLWGIGAISPEARRIAEDATLTALGHVVDACIEHRAAFLLLTGNCFDAAHACRGRMALEDACDRLAAHGVEVFIVPGESDPASAWTSGVHLPPNVTVFVSRPSDAVAVVRDSEVLATVEPYEERPSERSGRSSALRIGLIGAGQCAPLQAALAPAGESIDEQRLVKDFPQAAKFGYLALGNGSSRCTVQLSRGVAHDPGCPQPLDGRHTAANGCSLIDVDRASQLHIRRLPSAVVRREEIAFTLSGGESWDDLAQQMQIALLDRQPLSTEKLWLVRWVIDGDRSLADSLADASARKELCEFVEEELADDRGLIREHEIEFRSDWSRWEDVELCGSVLEEFTTLISEQLPAHVERFRSQLPALDWPESTWVKHVIDAGERIRPHSVAVIARDLAQRHLSPVETTRGKG